jgi:hypothetical protein
MRDAKKTGRSRYRIERRGFWRQRHMLVLQLEWEGFETLLIGGFPDTQFVRRWVDASVGDVTTMVAGARYGDGRLAAGAP